MGLDADFLAMLEATVTWKPVSGKDAWGNETYGTPTSQKAFIGDTTATFGNGTEGGQQDRTGVGTTEITMDALGVSVGDILIFGGVDHTVTEVVTTKDEFGNDLYQTVTVENQKKG